MHNLVWLVNDSIQPDNIWVVELSHNGSLFEQFVPALLLSLVEGLDCNLEYSLGGACPLSLVDHPKLPFAQLLSKGDALGLQLKGVFGSLPHLSLDSTKSHRWCPVLVILHLIATLEHCILLHNI